MKHPGRALAVIPAAMVPVVILMLHVSHAPDYAAALPGILIGLSILGLVHKRPCAA